MQKSFSALWDYATQIESGEMSIDQAENACHISAMAFAKEMRKQGYNAHMVRLGTQLREYWRFGVPCGLVCKCWLVNVD
jgi:hypothetical protein